MLSKYTFFGLPADLIAWLMVFAAVLTALVLSAARSR